MLVSYGTLCKVQSSEVMTVVKMEKKITIAERSSLLHEVVLLL
jgi:hypothetical protein